MKIQHKNILNFCICILIGILTWFLPAPTGLTSQSIHLFAIFLFTILGIILKPIPMGAIAILGLTLTLVTRTLNFAEAFHGFSNVVVWLVVIAFFIAKGFMKTGLGHRVAYFIMKGLGKNSLGMGYGVVLSDLILAPAIPSLTARIGGVVFPVVNSLARAFGSEPYNQPRKLGAYLISVSFQGAMITSAMFLTSMAGNPLIAEMATEVGVKLNWGTWALAASIPGILSLLIMPFLIYKIYPPELRATPDAKEFAEKQLKEMGPMTQSEWIMIIAFVILIILWVLGPFISMVATVAGLIGLSILLLTKVLTWDDVLSEKGAWNTLIWFSILIMLATYLNKFGLTQWFSEWFVGHMKGFHWTLGFLLLSLVYFYSHYFFASNVAHIGSMFPPFLMMSVGMGTPPIVAALTLGFFSSLFGGLTQYGCGPAPILFGSGYVKVGDWWRVGFIQSVSNIILWAGIGSLWWKILHLY